MDNYETLLSGGEEDFDFSTLLADDETQQTSFDNNQHQQQQIPTVIDPNAIYAVPSDMSTFDFYNPMSDNQNPSVTFQTTAPIIPVMFNNNYAPAMLQNMHPSMFSNAFFGAFNTSPSQFMTGSVSSNSLSPIGTQTTTDQSSTSGQSSGASTSKKKTPARKKKKTSSDSKSTKQTSSGSENEEEKMRKKAAANGKKRDAEEIDADMKRLMTLENAEDLTEQQKEEKKKLRNRYTAKVSRDRKKKELETLRDENHGLQKKLDEASVTIKTLKDQNEKLVQQNQYLQSQLAVVYSSYSMSAANNPDNRKGNTIMRSAVILLGIVLVFTVFTFLTGSFSYNSSAKTSSFTPSSPQPEQKTARRLARGLLSINGSNSDHAPNYGSRSATPPPPVESVGSKTLPTQSSPHSHSVNQHLPEPIYVENTMEMGESLEEDFNTDGMMSYDVFYPSKLKRHFSSFSYQNPKQNASEAAHIRNYDNSTSASPVPKKKKSVTSQRHNNSKQISVLTKPTMLSKRIEEKKHKYERATVYVPSENNIPSDKSELHMFCPYLYPLVAGVPDTGYEFSTKDFETSKKSSMKIHIPIQMVCNKTNAKVIRMAEINAENITLSDVFYEFNGPSLPPRSVVTN